MNGTPVGVPSAGTGLQNAAMVYDYAANKLWVYNTTDVTWHFVALT